MFWCKKEKKYTKEELDQAIRNEAWKEADKIFDKWKHNATEGKEYFSVIRKVEYLQGKCDAYALKSK